LSDVVGLLAQLRAKVEAEPDVAAKVFAEHPEWALVVQGAGREAVLVDTARKFTPEGFLAYYKGKHDYDANWMQEQWVRQWFAAHEAGRGYAINAFRGSGKSTSMDVDFVEWFIGLFPYKTNLIVSANDSSADKITKSITDTIEFHPFYRKVFPSVRPIEGKWSSEGYWVMDVSMSREKWVELTGGAIDPTLIGGGYTSTRINGKHPTGVCAVDDIHDKNNSTSDNERKSVVNFVTGTLMYTLIRKNDKLDTWMIYLGVPWGKGDDSFEVLKASGGFDFSIVPVMRPAQEGTGVYIDGMNEVTGTEYDDIKGWWTLNYPERWGVNAIKAARGAGKFEFWQMLMMDLRSASAGGLKYYTYNKEWIQRDWYAQAGADPSTMYSERGEVERKNSFFAIALLQRNPRGNVVVTEGVLEQCTVQQAGGHIMRLQTSYPNFGNTYVEGQGFGLAFLQTLRLTNPDLRLVKSTLPGMNPDGSGRIADKSARIRTELAPFLENAQIVISDDRSEYLDTLRDALDNFYELDPHKTDKRWDALDALYHAARAMPQALQTELPQEMRHVEKHPLAGRRQWWKN